ncbi:MAG: hypothetical protein JO129_02665 [Candidatus Dependentiae bacterium]|nr:hypothetical protein [Candidatus Dependentiae bacterium]
MQNMHGRHGLDEAIKFIMMFTLLTISESMYATLTTPAVPKKIAVTNQSNVPVTVSWTNASGAVTTSGSIAPGATGGLTYGANQSMNTVTVTYATSTPDAVNISFSPTTIATAIYVYGNSAVGVGSLDTTTAATPVPSRYVAWWTGSINTATDTTAAAAIADTQGAGALVTLYMVSIDGKNSILSF